MARTMTFKQCADAFIKAHRAGWRNPKHAAQWESIAMGVLVSENDPNFGHTENPPVLLGSFNSLEI